MLVALSALGAFAALAPISLPAHEAYLTDVALVTPPPSLGAVTSLLQSRGQTVMEPGKDQALHPLLVPLTRAADGEHTGLLRWPTAGGGGSKLPLVRTTKGGQQLELLADSAENFLMREAAIADVEGASDASAVAELLESCSGGSFSYTAGTAAASTGGLPGYLITKVGPIMSAYEELANGHRAKGSDQAALITCERSQSCFGAWGRPCAFHARMLNDLGRDEEARDKARAALELPLWTLGDDLEAIVNIAQMAPEALVADLELKAEGKLTPQQIAKNRGMEERTPQQIAKDRASYLLDLTVASPDDYSWSSVRPQLADLYREAGMSSIADFVACEQAQ